MGTWFDKDRGIRSGRIVPEVVHPASGQHVFILGAEGQSEPAILSPGDYTEVSQLVDLTGVDLVGATMETIGKIIGQVQGEAGFIYDEDTVFSFNFNLGTPGARNAVEGGFDLEQEGFVEIANETYSPNGKYCKRIPEAVPEAKLFGENIPNAFPSSLSEYTLQWWMNWNSNAFSVSTGVTPIILKTGIGDRTNEGLDIELSPIAPLHQWKLLVRHYNSVVIASTTIDYIFDQPLGWKMFSLRFKESLPTQFDLFINSSNVASGLTTLQSPDPNMSGAAIQVMSKDLVGDFDQARMIGRWMSDAEIEDSYLQCVSSPSPSLYKWNMQIMIDGRVYAERQIQPEETRTWTDFTAPVRILHGVHEVSYRLELATI